MKNTVSTLYGELIQACMFYKQPYVPMPFSTLNEKLGVQSGTPLLAGEIPGVGYLTIGNRGHQNVTGADGQPYPKAVEHYSTDASLFNMIPFVMRPLDNDLSVSERARFRQRKIENHNGIDYAVYYVMALDMSGSGPAPVTLTKVNGVVSSKPFVTDSSNLSPTPRNLTTGEVLTASGESVAVRSVLDVVLSATDIENIMEACRIIYDNEGYAIVSELGLVAAVDRQVTGPGPGNTTIEYTEAIAATVVGILSTFHSLPFANTYIKESMVLGTSNPLLAPTTV